MDTCTRLGPFLSIIDADGCRHLVRIASIQMISDADPCQDSTVLHAAGRVLTVSLSLDEIIALIAP